MRAGEGRQARRVPQRGEARQRGRGGGGPVKGSQVRPMRPAPSWEQGEGVGVGPAPADASGAPVAPAGGRAGKGEQTPVPGRGAGSAAAAAATSQPGPRLPLPLAVSPGLYGDRIRSLAPPPPAGWSPRPFLALRSRRGDDVAAPPGTAREKERAPPAAGSRGPEGGQRPQPPRSSSSEIECPSPQWARLCLRLLDGFSQWLRSPIVP